MKYILKSTNIVFLSVISCVVLLIIDRWFYSSYLIRTLFKILLLVMIPLFFIKTKRSVNFLYKKDFNLKFGLFLWLFSFSIIIIAYLLFWNFVDLDRIRFELLNNLKISKDNFIFISIYITFFNSFIEEFYFRGFIFLNVFEESPKFAYFFSSILFSLYHVSIFFTWFDKIWLFFLCLLGLFLWWLIFNLLNSKTKTLYNSWITHICADIAIMLIWYKFLFNFF